jgi:membrane-associated phospholipid phosphatase
MHAGFTTLGCLYGFKFNKRLGFALGLYGVAMCFAAIYSQHHYAIDLVIGIFYAVFAYLLIEKFFVGAVRKIYGVLFTVLISRAPLPFFGKRRKLIPVFS